ncbi:VENN motif pre-toxin domain-containing protein, partial [Providencia huaxiensis]|uniref:VENN motif pre-toxin domain-containing protein n=1 Tax=Providencia huaxiensis TaxID=2027290 RepID=UPI0032DAAC0F
LNTLFPGKEIWELSESEKQQVSALSQLASGLAGGLTTGDVAGAITGSQAAKNAVENNYLSDSEHRQKTSLELKEQQGKITEVEQQKLAELRIKDTETTQKLLDTCAGGVSPECTAARKDAFETIDTYVSLTYQNPKTAQAGYQEIERLLNSTSPEAQQAYNLLESYTEAFKNFGYTDEEARTRAGMYVGSIYLLGGMSAVANSGALVKQFGKDVAKPNVTTPKGNNAGAGSNWTADKNGAFSPKDDGIVTTVGKGDSKFDGNSLPYDKAPVVNPATNKVVTEHTVVSSGKAPKTSTPNSVYEVSRADGTKSITYYDDKGRTFSREDYGQQKTHGQLGYDANGKVPPHEHKINYNDRGYVDKRYYREIDKNGKPVGPWIEDKK